MEENVTKYDPYYNEEEEEIDLLPFFRKLWSGRKLIILLTVIFIALGLAAALTMRRNYRVTTVMVPQVSTPRSSSLSSLASLAGFDVGGSVSSELSPVTYPQIVSSVPFQLEMMRTPLHYSKLDTPVTWQEYEQQYAKPSFSEALKKYTIGLPRVIMGALRGKKAPVELPEDISDDESKPLVVTEEERDMMEFINRNLSLSVDKKEGYLTLSVVGSEPVQTAELAMKALQLLQDEITRFRTEKALSELAYVQARYDEIKVEADSYQYQLALVQDRSQNMPTTRSRIEEDRLRSKYNIANSIYSEMAMQLEQAKMQVKKDTPAFTILQPVTVPNRATNSRSKTLILWTLIGFVLGCGIVLTGDFIKGLFGSSPDKKK